MGVRVRDRGASRVVREIKARGTSGVEVGVLGTKGAAAHRGSDEGITVAEIAEIHEFGLGVPERSWLRAWVDENESKIKARIRKETQAMIREKRPRAQVIARIGVWIQGEIQQRIADGIPPENAETTIQRKGSSTPLIDQGQMRQSITYRVV